MNGVFAPHSSSFTIDEVDDSRPCPNIATRGSCGAGRSWVRRRKQAWLLLRAPPSLKSTDMSRASEIRLALGLVGAREAALGDDGPLGAVQGRAPENFVAGEHVK